MASDFRRRCPTCFLERPPAICHTDNYRRTRWMVWQESKRVRTEPTTYLVRILEHVHFAPTTTSGSLHRATPRSLTAARRDQHSPLIPTFVTYEAGKDTD